MSEKKQHAIEYERPTPDAVSQWIRLLQPRARTALAARLVHPWGFRVDLQDDALIHRIESGRGVFTNENTQFHVAEGDLIIVVGGPTFTLTSAPGVRPSTRFPNVPPIPAEPSVSAEVTEVSTVLFRLGIHPNSRLRRSLPEVMHVPSKAGEPPEWIPLLESVADFAGVRSESGASDIADLLSQLFFALALRSYQKNIHSLTGVDLSGRNARLLDLLFEVRAHPSAPWSIDRMAERVTLSRSAFCDLFLKTMAEPPMEYVTRIRMALAADLLSTTDLAPGEIAEATGYGSAASLIRAFNRYHDVSFGNYRHRERAQMAPARGRSVASLRAE